MPLSEFELIARYFRDLSPARDEVPLAVGDDCAALLPPAGQQLLISVDTLVEGVHFPRAIDPGQLARRALAVCVSDLAACGAQPLAFTLALTLPEVDETWITAFAGSLKTAARDYDISLIGGDTTRGPRTLTLQVMGSAPPGQTLLRSGAQVGDCVFVSGYPGQARAALDYLNTANPTATQQQLLAQYFNPQPRLALGLALRGLATAAVDVSDGLVADLDHILDASAVAATLQLQSLPLAPALLQEAGTKALDYALGGGDDYELCFTVAPSQRQAIAELAKTLDLPLTEIGVIEAGCGLRCLDSQGKEFPLPSGYRHF